MHDLILKEAKKLHKTGFALHWLMPRSKKPFEMNWSKLPKKTWPDLEQKFKSGYNLGVRLGSVSLVGDKHFLAVIDCDVKSRDPKDQAEMRQKLKELFPQIELSVTPRVLSGRGNGSMHLYVKTEKPAKPSILARAARYIKVMLADHTKPSKRDLEHLNAKEIEKGYRMRPAWEIGLMGEGQQVVLPPSIHPDTGRSYEWDEVKSLNPESFPLIEVVAKEKSLGDTLGDFKPVEVDLVTSGISDEILKLIVTGENCDGDKSASMFKACLALSRTELSDNEILSVLTDPENYLGEVGYRHSQSRNRERAARWVFRYCLKKAREETGGKKDFSGDGAFSGADFETPLDEKQKEEIKKESEEVLELRDWRQGIERHSDKQGGAPKNTAKNVVLILSNEFGGDLFAFNEFMHLEIFNKTAEVFNHKVTRGQIVTDRHTTAIKMWLSTHYRFEPSDTVMRDAIRSFCDNNVFHPIRDYLDSLEWDGVSRVDDWLTTYLGATGPSEYLKAVGRKTLCAMIARVFQPGCKFDHVLILQGETGIRKSTAVRVLASDEWFSDTTFDIRDKDAVMNITSAWVIELGELSSMKKADVDHLKEFISRTTDRIRVPYGKRIEMFPRQCVFIGTTNNEEFLKDPTGNRRYWPVNVTFCDTDALARDRDQLFAEAYLLWGLGEKLFLDDSLAASQALSEQESRREKDIFEELLDKYFSSEECDLDIKGGFLVSELFDEYKGPLRKQRMGTFEIMRAAGALKKLGFFKNRERRENGKRNIYWYKP
jgi:predicted P-loop ATPase